MSIDVSRKEDIHRRLTIHWEHTDFKTAWTIKNYKPEAPNTSVKEELWKDLTQHESTKKTWTVHGTS